MYELHHIIGSVIPAFLTKHANANPAHRLSRVCREQLLSDQGVFAVMNHSYVLNNQRTVGHTICHYLITCHGAQEYKKKPRTTEANLEK
jgi:hypothetical protein